jgi:hypothetical protein
VAYTAPNGVAHRLAASVAQADGHCRGGGGYGEPVGGKPCPDGLLLRGLDGANRRGGQIGGQRGNKRHGVNAEQVMTPSDAATAAVGYIQ